MNTYYICSMHERMNCMHLVEMPNPWDTITIQRHGEIYAGRRASEGKDRKRRGTNTHTHTRHTRISYNRCDVQVFTQTKPGERSRITTTNG